MFATGFFLSVLGIFMVRVWGSSPVESHFGRYNKADYIGGALALAGFAILLIAICVILWKELP
jgi:hypothetical protein